MTNWPTCRAPMRPACPGPIRYTRASPILSPPNCGTGWNGCRPATRPPRTTPTAPASHQSLTTPTASYPIPGDPDYRPDTPETADTEQASEHVTIAADASLDQDMQSAADIRLDRDPETAADASPTRDAQTAADPAEQEDISPHVEPLTDAEYAEHVRDVRERLDQARQQGRATNEEYTIDTRGEVWLEQRETFHDALIDELYAHAAKAPAEHKAIIAGGLPGAGKSTVLERYAGIDRSCFLTIDPDKVKEELARHDLIPVVEGLSPMEASDLVHEESSHIAKRLARRAQADGKNVIWDITMSTTVSTEQRIEALRACGYTHIEGIFVDIPLDTSEERATVRHRMDQDEYHAGKGQGGRLIPADLTSNSGDPDWGSVNRRTFRRSQTQVRRVVTLRQLCRWSGPGAHGFIREGRETTMTNEVKDLIAALRDGSLSLEEVAQRFRERTWPRTARPRPTSYLEMAAAANRDPEPDVPGSL